MEMKIQAGSKLSGPRHCIAKDRALRGLENVASADVDGKNMCGSASIKP
jgi:hypothetical protein